MSHFKTVLLFVVAALAQSSFAGQCYERNRIAATLCYDENSGAPAVGASFETRNNAAIAVSNQYAINFAGCDAAYNACLEICKDEHDNADDPDKKDEIADLMVECEKGTIGQDHRMMKMATIMANQETAATTAQRATAANGRWERASATPSQGITTLPGFR